MLNLAALFLAENDHVIFHDHKGPGLVLVPSSHVYVQTMLWISTSCEKACPLRYHGITQAAV